tara:strand:+ start:271 stop:453 length:183 start_codon:yes stop_codon:yes gene_type:complete
MIKIGDLVRIAEPFMDYQGQVGIVTKIPLTERGRWAILLTSGELIATRLMSRMEVINASR